jgi:hypothetical protein
MRSDLDSRFPRYRRLLKLYPKAYRQEYAAQTLQTLADMLDDPEHSRLNVWTRTLLDLPVSVLRQQISCTAAAMTTTPTYLKHYARSGAWMVAPFFLLVALNSLGGQALRRSVLWHTNVLFTWLILLPALAALLNLAAWLHWVGQTRRERGVSAWRAVTDLRRSWPALAVTVIGIGIIAFVYGHDSVHCLTGNPVRELHNAHQTLQCVQRG